MSEKKKKRVEVWQISGNLGLKSWKQENYRKCGTKNLYTNYVPKPQMSTKLGMCREEEKAPGKILPFQESRLKNTVTGN